MAVPRRRPRSRSSRALLYYPGPIETLRRDARRLLARRRRCISKTDALYLSTPTRADRPAARRGVRHGVAPGARSRGRCAARAGCSTSPPSLGLLGLGALCWYLHIVTADGADPWLFRGGLLRHGARDAARHRRRHPRRAGPAPCSATPLSVDRHRSYGLYLYHWPIYQIMRGWPAGRCRSPVRDAVVLAVVVTEISYRLIETPIRRARSGAGGAGCSRPRPGPARLIAGAGARVVALSVFAVANLATAQLKPNEIAQSLDEGAGAVGTTQRPAADDGHTDVRW
jgi:hypothetical protein